MVTDHRHSSLHHERSYLLSALATQESRAEYLTRALESAKAKLQIARAEEDSADATANLKKAAAAITKKLKKCQKNQRAMANNLAAVTTLMQMLEQHRWRKAQFEYSHNRQRAPLYEMTLGIQDINLDPTIRPTYGYPFTPYPPAAYTPSLPIAPLPSMPATPLLQPQPMINMEHAWNMPLPMPCYGPYQPQFSISPPFNTPHYGMSHNWNHTNSQYLPNPVPAKSVGGGRRLSLPNPPRKDSWHTSGSLGGIGPAPRVDATTVELGTRLSMVGSGSASLKTQRLSQ
jgi:hypothetical protein